MFRASKETKKKEEEIDKKNRIHINQAKQCENPSTIM